MNRCALAAWAPLIIVAAGCGSDTPIGRVHGRVAFQGKPLTEGVVYFSNSQAAVHLTTKIETDGSYVLKTYDANGLPYGDYVVTVLPPAADLVTGQPTQPQKEFPNIPARYRDAATSGLKLTINARDNPFNIDMQAEPADSQTSR